MIIKHFLRDRVNFTIFQDPGAKHSGIKTQILGTQNSTTSKSFKCVCSWKCMLLFLSNITSTYLILKCKKQPPTQNLFHLLSKSCSENSQKEMLPFSTITQRLQALTWKSGVTDSYRTN